MSHECGCSMTTPGILWPWMPEGDDSLPWVQRCDDCQVYVSDTAAAYALVEIIGGRVMFAALAKDEENIDLVEDHLRPFVFAFPDSTLKLPALELTGGRLLGYPTRQPSMWEKWLKEKGRRFHALYGEEKA